MICLRRRDERRVYGNGQLLLKTVLEQVFSIPSNEDS